MIRRSVYNVSDSESDDDSTFKDDVWRQEDSMWIDRTDGKYVTFRWSSSCGSGKLLYSGQIIDHYSSLESGKRVDYLVIFSDGEEHSYKLGKDIRQFTIYSDKKFTKSVSEWSRAGWTFPDQENINYSQQLSKNRVNSTSTPPQKKRRNELKREEVEEARVDVTKVYVKEVERVHVAREDVDEVAPGTLTTTEMKPGTFGVSNYFCGGIASKEKDFYFYRSAAEICGRRII